MGNCPHSGDFKGLLTGKKFGEFPIQITGNFFPSRLSSKLYPTSISSLRGQPDKPPVATYCTMGLLSASLGRPTRLALGNPRVQFLLGSGSEALDSHADMRTLFTLMRVWLTNEKFAWISSKGKEYLLWVKEIMLGLMMALFYFYDYLGRSKS